MDTQKKKQAIVDCVLIVAAGIDENQTPEIITHNAWVDYMEHIEDLWSSGEDVEEQIEELEKHKVEIIEKAQEVRKSLMDNWKI